MKKSKRKVLYKFSAHPYVNLTQEGKYLTLVFQDSQSSYSHWFTIKFFWVEELKQFVRLEEQDDE